LLMFEALSEIASRAIAKSRMYEELLAKARIEKENHELRVLDRKKSDFINMLSHEFRTPLTVIQGYGERLKSGRSTDMEQIKNQAGIIYEEAKRLSRMVDELLDISRLKSGKHQIDRVEADMSMILEGAVESLKARAGGKDITVTLQIAKRPIQTVVDIDKIYQVVYNLVDNAIKYTQTGGQIEVRADEVPTLELQGDVFVSSVTQVTVTDNGVGIALADKEKIFEEFYRTDVALGTKERGTGLGLSICRGIVQAHGGRIWVESEPGKGSRFVFTIPHYQPIEKLSEHKFRP